MPRLSLPYLVTVLLLPLLAALFAVAARAATATAAAAPLWRDVAEQQLTGGGERWIVPQAYRVLALDETQLFARLAEAPLEQPGLLRQSPAVIELPLPDGGFGRFQFVLSPIMAPELAARYPEIRTFSGQGLDDPAATVRFDHTPAGFHAMIIAPSGTIFIDPYRRGDTTHYISYFKRDFRDNADWLDIVEPTPGGVPETSGPLPPVGATLRTYRLAVATTGEYTIFHGGTVAAGLAAVVTSVNRVTQIYEREVAVRMVLIPNNDLIIYTNPSTDPYTNGSGTTMLGQNQTNLDAVIGNANYDIGHVFSTGGGGVASLGVVCRTGLKARGVTGRSAPVGDPFDVDYVAHEMGHQYAGNHSFNGNAGSCAGGNRNGSTAYEPGSGSTIMAYAGICSAQNLQSNSDDYFHTVNFDEIVAYTRTGSGNTCGVDRATGNTPPVVNPGVGGFTIPASTPFALTGSATDAEGDALTYNWEQFDLGSAGAPSGSNPPFFRSWPALSSPTRHFPRLSELVNNTTVIGDNLPTVTRSVNFRLTVRDNRANGGGVDRASIAFNVTNAAGPFQVTAPNTAVTWMGNSEETVTWNVANTAASPVSCANVDILLSTDGGFTYPTTLLSSTPNDGAQPITVPNLATTTARVRVQCSDNIFFDISNANFAIQAIPLAVGLAQSGAGATATYLPALVGLLAVLGLGVWMARRPHAPRA